MKINGKEIKDIIKDGVMNIVGDIKSIKVSNVMDADGDVTGGTKFVQTVNGVNAKGSQFGCINSCSSFTQRIVVNGEEIDSEFSQGVREINITGNVGTVDTQGRVVVGGDAGKVRTQGSVEVEGSVNGDVNTQGKVSCGDVKGSVKTMGQVECGTVGGDVNTMGKVVIN